MSEYGAVVVYYNSSDAELPLGMMVIREVCAMRLPGVVKCVHKHTHAMVKLMGTQEEFHGSDLVMRFLARFLDHKVGTTYYGDHSDARTATQIDFFIELSKNELKLKNAVFEQTLEQMNQHLELRTFFVGATFTIADFAVWGALKYNTRWHNILSSKKDALPHLRRWYDSCENAPEFETTVEAHRRYSKSKRTEDKSNANKTTTGDAKSGETKTSDAAAATTTTSEQEGGSFDIDLPGAAMGHVVTRFPPEPSGYLHIGHAKAALLNYHIAQRFRGRMLLRFDDTNPSKEKDEYVQNILHDLETLQIKYDVLTHTSDHFDKILDYGTQLLKAGKGYIDDTPVEQMRKERMDGIESKNRNNSIEKNLELWEEMKKASPEGLKCVMRGKIDMQAKNKALRDPSFFRCNLQPHHRVGTKYKVYPIYDFACPIVDAIEGVTHALRTQEYHDRNEQYQWVLDALGLRTVHIWDFARLSFANTVMSKRKLQWFVDQGLVEGWTDPRFPTVQGIIRRGLTISAMKEFVRLQGASKNEANMTWDKLWSMNARILDTTAFRFNAVARDTAVPLELTDAQPQEIKEIPLIPKNPAAGSKKLYLTKTILLEGDDAQMITQNEEITIMGWGNVIVNEIHKNQQDKVISLRGRLNLQGDFKKTDKKLHWVPKLDNLVPFTMVEFDHLITVPKIEEDMVFEDIVNQHSKFETAMLGEPSMNIAKPTDVVQLQRRGFCRFDKANPNTFIFIPDGKKKAMSVVGGKVAKS